MRRLFLAGFGIDEERNHDGTAGTTSFFLGGGESSNNVAIHSVNRIWFHGVKPDYVRVV